MERRKFFKSIGLLSLGAVMPKFLFGDKKPTQIEAGSFLKESCTTENDIKVKEDKTVTWSDSKIGFIPKNYSLEKSEYKYACLIVDDVLTGETKLYVTNNVDSAKIYILDKENSGTLNFILVSLK